MYWDFIGEHLCHKEVMFVVKNVSNRTQNVVKIYIHLYLGKRGPILPEKKELVQLCCFCFGQNWAFKKRVEDLKY